MLIFNGPAGVKRTMFSKGFLPANAGSAPHNKARVSEGATDPKISCKTMPSKTFLLPSSSRTRMVVDRLEIALWL